MERHCGNTGQLHNFIKVSSSGSCIPHGPHYMKQVYCVRVDQYEGNMIITLQQH